MDIVAIALALALFAALWAAIEGLDRIR